RHDSVSLESPPCIAEAGEAGLYFVGDVETSCRVDRVHHRAQESRRIREDAVAGEDAVGVKGGHAETAPLELPDRVLDLLSHEGGHVAVPCGAGVGGGDHLNVSPEW